MANVCGRCKRSMSSHDDHASCPQCRMAAGECSLDLENPCNFCREWTSNSGGTEKVLGGRQGESQPVRETAQVWIKPSLDSKRGFCQNQYLPLPQKSLPRLVKVFSRIIYWSALQTSKLSRFWWCKLKMGSTWRLVRPLRHPVRPLRHPVRHPCS